MRRELEELTGLARDVIADGVHGCAAVEGATDELDVVCGRGELWLERERQIVDRDDGGDARGWSDEVRAVDDVDRARPVLDPRKGRAPPQCLHDAGGHGSHGRPRVRRDRARERAAPPPGDRVDRELDLAALGEGVDHRRGRVPDSGADAEQRSTVERNPQARRGADVAVAGSRIRGGCSGRSRRFAVHRDDARGEDERGGRSQMTRIDVVVVGGGIVGLATARAIARSHPELRLVLLEKEREVAQHQTGRNSGVLHSGIYYRPGSLKAAMAVQGRLAMERFCDEHGVPFERCGKVIVAVDRRELPRVERLAERAVANGVRAARIDRARLRELEPAVSGIGGLHVPETGVVDFGAVATSLAKELEQLGAVIHRGERVITVTERDDRVAVETDTAAFAARILVNCAGLHSDEIARDALGARPDVRIVPFRGEYHELVGPSAGRVRHLVYPVPDPDLPFLGVHISRGIDGQVHVGPNAVLALRREGYTWGAVDLRELGRLARFPGFWKLARRYWRVSAEEIHRSLSRRALARAVSRMLPGVTARDLVPSPAGVRAQALGRDGTLHDDFVLRETARAVHVLNAPSPAATASLVIGQEIARACERAALSRFRSRVARARSARRGA